MSVLRGPSILSEIKEALCPGYATFSGKRTIARTDKCPYELWPATAGEYAA